MAGKSPMQKITEAGTTPMRDQPDKAFGKSVTIEGLQEKYGKKRGRELYYDIALAGGFGDFRGFASQATPPLDLTGLDIAANKERKAAVDALLADADAKEAEKDAKSAEE